jgi:hypothetical protein
VGHAEARQWIVTRYAQQFDPAVVEAFIARESDFERISVKGAPVKLEASDGHAGSDVDVSEVLTTN